jgi:uncharacterized protein (DUF1697 family)
MSRYVAFLRGMNVGGHRLTNDELRAQFTSMGFSEVATFRASGNVVFATEDGGQREHNALQERIEAGLADSLGYAVPTFIRDAAAVRAIAAKAPFDAERLSSSAGKLQVALLTAPAPPGARADLQSLAGARDGVVFDDRELYWLPSAGVLESALDMKRIESLLGPMTMRTKGTIEQIASRHCG